MLKLENQVTSVELSNKIHQLGITTPSLFYRDSQKSKESEIESWGKPDYCPDNVNCYTVAEIGNMLPKGHVATYLLKDNKCLCTYRESEESDFVDFFDKSEANCKAKVMIYLLENKLITL